MKKILIFLLAYMCLTLCSCNLSSDSKTTSDKEPNITTDEVTTPDSSTPEATLPNIDYIKVYAPVEYKNIYVWVNNKEVCGKWPGTKMDSYDSLWNTYDIKGYEEINLIFNTNGSDHKTKDLFISGYGHYFYVDGEFVNSMPEVPEVTTPEATTPEETTPNENGYEVRFNKNGYFDVVVYKDKSLTNGYVAESTFAVNLDTLKPQFDGNDAVIFSINLSDNYVLASVTSNNPNTNLIKQGDYYYLYNVDNNTTVSIIARNQSIMDKEIKPIGNIASGKDFYDEKSTIGYYDDLFDLDNKVTIDFDIDKDELYKIEKDYQKYKGYKCNIYRVINKLTITITYPDGSKFTESIDEVGIRMKGNTTRHSFTDSNGNIFSFISFKLDFQETFDDEVDYTAAERKSWDDTNARSNRKNRTFFGLSGLELKFNAEADITYTRDIYSAYTYRANGIYAQNTTLGVLNLDIKDGSKTLQKGSMGVYKIYEPVDRVYIKRYFESENNDGDLYKATWGSSTGMPDLNHKNSSAYGVDDEPWGTHQTVSFDLKTNKSSSTQEKMKNFLYWINDNKDLNSTLSQYINEDYFLTFMALQYLSGDWDNFMYDSNNYYIYFGDDALAYFIPYDMDRTYGIAASSQADKSDLENSHMCFMMPLAKFNLQNLDNRSNLIKRTIDITNSRLQKAYLARIKELAPSVLNYAKFEEIYNKLYKNYKDDITPTLPSLMNYINSFEDIYDLDKYYNHIKISIELGKNMMIDLTGCQNVSDPNVYWGASYIPKAYFEIKQQTVDKYC